AQVFAGNRLLPGSEPLAAVYSGHQFGVWAGQLGDGRAHLLGEVSGADSGWEIQLKGAGQTPYSRFADGRAVLRSSIREFLCSEAMAALGIPTTRALSVVGSHAPVRREAIETAAVVARLAPSFIRFGSFEHWAARNKPAELRQLADYVIDRFRPECREAANPYAALLADVGRRTGETIAKWQAVGFMHGVMNTDNMSILGLTLDYGPFGFMDAFDAGHICNHSDDRGRYSYKSQPQIGHWNLYALGSALAALIGEPDAVQAAIEESYAPSFEGHFMDLMRAKLGLARALPGDEDFIGETFGLLQQQHPDYTQFFRRLGELPAQVDEATRTAADAPLRDLVIDRDGLDAWLALWRARLGAEGRPDAERQAAMRAVNPKYVLRNWIAEAAIRAAQGGNFTEVENVLACLAKPFDEQPEFERFAAPPPDWAAGLAVSCSS
nr:YdiU family protein [Zoogloea sp.]